MADARYLLGDAPALHRGGTGAGGGFAMVPAGHGELGRGDGVEYGCGGGGVGGPGAVQLGRGGHHAASPPTYKVEVDSADQTLTSTRTTSCLRLMADSDDRDQV